MSFDEWSNNKKKKKTSSFEEWSNANHGVSKKQEEEDEKKRQAYLSTVRNNSDIAPVRGDVEERTWFKKSEGNLFQTILGSGTDVTEHATGGFLGTFEKVVDAGLTLGAMMNQQNMMQAAQDEMMFNAISGKKDEGVLKRYQGVQKEVEDKTAEFVAKDLYDEEAVAKAIISDPMRKVGIDSERHSVFGEKSDALAMSAGQLGGQLAVSAIPGVGQVGGTILMGATAFGSEAESAFRNDAEFSEAILSAAVSAGAEMLSEKIGGVKFGGKTLTDAAFGKLSSRVTGKLAKTLVSAGKISADALAEGGEELLSGYMSAVGQKLTYMEDKEIEELFSNEDKLESFIGGIVLGGAFSVGESAISGRNAASGLTKHEQAVVDKVSGDIIAEKETGGKTLTDKEKAKIRESVVDQMEKGQIDIDTIESVLGGDSYKAYKDTVESEDALKTELDELRKMKSSDMNDLQVERMNELKGMNLNDTTKRDGLRKALDDTISPMLKDSKLAESYRERERRGQAFEADLSKYTGKKREAVERAVKSGVLNNTYRSHELVEVLSNIEAEKGIVFDYTNNAKLKESGFAVEGKTVNGFANKSKGTVTLNVQSAKAWQSVVGHEITHVLETNPEAYNALRESLYAYAESKGELEGRRASLTALYQNMDADIEAELTADLVGDYLFTDKDFVSKLTGNRTLFQKIYDEIKYLWNKATGKEKTEIEKVKDEFDRVWKEYSNNTEEISEADDSGESDIDYSISVTDKDTLDSLNEQVARGEYDAETNPDGGYYVTYKSMSFWGYDEDGNAILRSPMAEYVDGELSKAYLIPKDKSKLNWYQATETIDENTGLPSGLLVKAKQDGKKSFSYLPASENQDLIAEDWSNLYFNLRKKILKNGKWVNSDVPARYNPYEHSSNSMLNDQFTAAYQRDNLVTVKMIVPRSEDGGTYRAQWSKDPTGWSDWKSGIVAGKIAKQKDLQRRVYLSRYAAPVEIVPDSEVAQAYKEYLEGTDVAIPDNVVSPNLLNELRKAGVPIEESGKVQLSLSSIANTFYGDENMSAIAFEEADYKQTDGYKNYVSQCLNNMRQSRADFDETAATEEIEKQIDGIVRVALAAKKAGYDIHDDANKRDKTDSKNRLLFSSLEPNSEYFTSNDISTICDKRKNFAEIYDDIVRAEEAKGVPKGKRFFDNVDNYFYLHNVLAAKGLTQPCRECYVESMRKNLAPMANAFLKLVNEMDANNKANDQLYHPSGKNKGQLKTSNAELRAKVLETFETHPEYGMSVGDLTVETLTTEYGLAQLKIRAPLIYEAFNSFYGQSKPKMPKAATPFRFGELTALLTDHDGKIKQSLVDKINSTGGFRLQSYSDFQIQNYTDVLQVIFEAGTLGLNGHAYTKVPAFLEATEGTNLKRNISIFMYKDGNEWKIDRNDSFPYTLEEIYDIVNSDKSGNTSIIAVSQNKEMSAWIMANDYVGQGIPFHKSGMKMGTVRNTDVKTEDGRIVKGYSGTIDHTKQQTEVWAKANADHKALTKVKKGIDIYSFWDFDNKENLSKNELIEKNLKAYIDACEEAGYLPKFRDYVMNNGTVLNDVLKYSKELGFASQDATIDDISFEYKGYRIPYGYYKFLGDFGMFKPDGTASPHDTLSLNNYDFDKAEQFFSDAESLRRNEILQQFANGEERQKYRDSNLDAEQLDEIIHQKRKEVVDEIVAPVKPKPDVQYSISPDTDADYMSAVERGDTETAQRMVDEAAKNAGYTRKLYHGTASKFNVFGFGRTGIFTTDNFDMAKTYGNNVMSLYGKEGAKVLHIDANESPHWAIEVSKDVLDFSEYPLMRGKERYSTNDISLIAFREGYDVVVIDNVYDNYSAASGNTENGLGTDVVYKDPNQVKSSEAVTYDDNGNVIPLSQRFNTENDDIRYSLSNEGEEHPIKGGGTWRTPFRELAYEDIAPTPKTVRETPKTEEAPSLADIPVLPDDELEDGTYAAIKPNKEKPAAPKSERIADGSRSDELLYESLDNHPVQTLEQKIAEKIRALHGEIADKKDLRREKWDDYESRIADLRAKYNSKKNKNTKEASEILQSISRLERMKASDDADFSKRISDLEARIQKMSDPKYGTAMQKRAKMEADAKWAADLLGDTSTWVDKKIGLQYATNTERRNLRDIVRDENGNVDIAKADAIDDALNGQYNRDEAAKKKELAKVRGKYADLKITKAEDAYIQMLGEFRHNPDTSLTDKDISEYYEKHKSKIDTEKVDKVIEMARQDYDSWLNRVNAELKKQGMKEIPYRQGYFPHFTEPKQNFIQKLLNWKTQDNEIPTSIAGLTETFKPTRSWQSFDKRRYSDETDYSFMKGFDSYSEGALDWIYHMDTLQKRRAVENHIRYTHSDKGISDRIKAVYASEDIDANEAQAQIEHILSEAKNPLNNFVQDFTTHTNILAGKKNSLDRTVEQWTNRHIYSVMTNVQNRMSANMVLANVRSALTNFIPITQSWAQVSPLRSLQAAKDTIANSIKDDGTVDKSSFLTNRLREVDKLYQTNWDKVLDKAGIMFEIVDNFSSQVIWRSKYNQNLADGMSEAEAIRNADQFAENVMAGRSKGNEPTLFNAKNPFVKAFTMFQLEVNNQYGYLFKDVPNDLKAETEHWKFNLAKGYTAVFVGAYVYNALLEKVTGSDAALDPIGIVEELLRDLGLFGDDEEEEPEKVVTNLLGNVAEELPFIGGVLGGGRVPISSAIPYGGEYGGGLTGFVEDVGNIGDGGLKNIGKELMKPILNVGLPVAGNQIKKTYQGLKMFSDDHPVSGSYTTGGSLRFPVEDTPLNRAQAAIFGQYASKNAREYFDNDYAPLNEKQIREYIDVDIPIKDYWEYREGLSDLAPLPGKNSVSLEQKLDYVDSMDLPTRKKNILANNLTERKDPIDMTSYGDYDSLEEFDFAAKSPDKYAFAKSVGGYSAYKTYSKDLDGIHADKDANGKSIKDSRKEKVINYINSLDADYYAKIILYKSEYPSDDTYNYEIVKYINDRSDLTYEERVGVLTQLGFRVTADGQIYAE